MAIVTMRHVNELPKHCTPGVIRYLRRLDLTIADLLAGRLDSARLRSLGGHIANTVADAAERDELAAGGKEESGDNV